MNPAFRQPCESRPIESVEKSLPPPTRDAANTPPSTRKGGVRPVEFACERLADAAPAALPLNDIGLQVADLTIGRVYDHKLSWADMRSGMAIGYEMGDTPFWKVVEHHQRPIF